MDKPQELTCILCKEKIPAEEQTHHCEDGKGVVTITKQVMPSGMPETFFIRGMVPTTAKCGCCHNSLVPITIIVTAIGQYVPGAICEDCAKEREIEKLELEEKNRKNAKMLADAQMEWNEKYGNALDPDVNSVELPMSTQCEYCGKMLTLTKEDFIEHQNACKSDNQI